MGNTPEQDEELVRELYSRYRRPLHGYVLRAVGGDHQRAEDVVQETLLRAWRNAESLDADHAGPWLYTVARNLIISGYRRQSARVAEVPIQEGDWPRAADDYDRVLQGWQVAEAATELGIPAGTVKSRSFYALRALRDALAERGVTEP